MKTKERRQTGRDRKTLLAAACLGLGMGCTGQFSDPASTPGSSGSGAGAGTGGSGGPGAGTGSPGDPSQCKGAEVTNAKRVIRLSFNQIANSIGALLGTAAQTLIQTKFEIEEPTTRTFPPLASAREGSVYTDSAWQDADAIAQEAGKYVFDNFAAVTSCGAAPTDACGQQYVRTFAQRAFRRPLSTAEETRIMQVYADTRTAGGTIDEAVQYGVYAAIQSPLFLYRTELGTGATEDGALSSYEMASELALFLTDGPPDQALLDAAAQNRLIEPADIEGHVTRILATPLARQNMEAAIVSYFALPGVLTVQIDPTLVPEFTPGLANSMYHEAELFVRDVLWNRNLNDFLTSRRAVINQSLATLYGLSFPPAGATLDSDQFAAVDLPASRAGMLTQAAFLSSKARPNVPSVVGRGLIVNRTVVCQENPQFPTELADRIAEVSMMLAGQSERQKADFRATNAPCSGCHPQFDPYGLALENYDIIGRFQTNDPEGRPIDAHVTLPKVAGGQSATGAVDMAAKIAANGSFVTCMAKNLLSYAMAEGSAIYPDSCSTQQIASTFKTGDQSFTSLVRAVAVSKSFALRTAGGSQ